jgi:hypothetical protein
MAAVELTFDQILEAVRQWPPSQRKSLLKAIEALPTSEKARAAAQRLHGKYRMSVKKRQRMSQLLSRGNAGTLTPEERDELDGLVEEFERKTLAMAQTLAAERDGRKAPVHPRVPYRRQEELGARPGQGEE